MLLSVLSFVTIGERVVSGQQNTSGPILAGVAAKIPTIDGIWHVGEWDDAVQYQSAGAAYPNAWWHGTFFFVRFKHDATFLYVLVDAVSDDGSTNSGGLDLKLDLNLKGYDSQEGVHIDDYLLSVDNSWPDSTNFGS